MTRLLIITAVFLAARSGCTKGDELNKSDLAPGPSASAALPKDSSGIYSGDDGWARLALEVPGGFAGIYLDETGRPVLLLTHPELKDDAIAALSSRQFVALLPGTDLHNSTVKRAKWNFAQLYDWAHSAKVRISVPVLTSDIDEVHNRLDFGVLKRDVATAEADLKKLSLPARLVRVHAQTPVIMD